MEMLKLIHPDRTYNFLFAIPVEPPTPPLPCPPGLYQR